MLLVPLDTAQADSAGRLDALRALDAALETAPDQDEIRTTLKLAHGYITGRDRDERNVATGISLAEDLAEQGVAEAQFLLGMVYTSPELGYLDRGKAFAMLRRAASQEFPPAYVALADLYLNGWGTEGDPAEAWRLFQQAAGESGQAAAAGELGMGLMLLEGLHVERDEALGLSLLRQSAEAGYPHAQLVMGEMSARDDIGGPADYDQATRWFEQALEQGYVHAATALGQLHEQGLGRPKDAGKAAEYYRQAAEAGEPGALAGLARLHETGRGVPRDQAKARELYARAEALGGPAAPSMQSEPPPAAASPLQGFWYRARPSERVTPHDARQFEIIAADGRMGILEKLSERQYRVGTKTRVALAGDTARYFISGEDEPRQYRMRIEDADTIFLTHPDEPGFVMHRLPEDRHMLRAMLRLTLTGEAVGFSARDIVHSSEPQSSEQMLEDLFGSSGEREALASRDKTPLFDGSRSFVASMWGHADIILAQMPGPPFSGVLYRDGEPWMAALSGSVVAIGDAGAKGWSYMGEVLREAARPLSADN
ncbi:tetratricopeptide repeat protein [Halomonas faecis]|uniref:tetratricopeptide repeat protein n=1 Tax=Halomonas faecis TaxID=1562110 RepID=UPI001F08FA91|nr:tetratricopeptide repeat protein [Halomonas faecis]